MSNKVNPETLFAYMDLLNQGVTHKEISSSYLEGVSQEIEVRYEEEKARLLALLQRSLQEREEDAKNALDETANIAITALAEKTVADYRQDLTALKRERKTLEEILTSKRSQLKESHQQMQHLQGSLGAFRAQLNQTPAEYGWIDRGKLVERTRAFCLCYEEKVNEERRRILNTGPLKHETLEVKNASWERKMQDLEAKNSLEASKRVLEELRQKEESTL